MKKPHPSDETIFADALERPAVERAAYLEAACASDTALRARIESLLRAHDEAARFMATSALNPLAQTRMQGVPLEKSGDVIGRYKLLQKLGEGGCGTVYMAEQQEPVVRRVALKVIKLGMDTREVVARFEAERQALALMNHPNIASVLDGGATDTGRPFFVMELVRGVPITKFCDEQSLPTRARLELFTSVCHAVQHAHQKGIIHRDLKPSNILVTLHDGKPVPKVIDFGIAKATQGRLTDHTLFTAFEQFIGTPAYMSPEQAEMSGLDIDTRSDIYSLGVLLYELLTGRPPFDPKTLLAAGLDEIRRIIRKVDPPRPSTRLSTLNDLDRVTLAKQRGLGPSQHSSLLRGDLDWIVMRCLEKDRTRRYETANGVAADVLRHLRDEPIVARPPGAVYRFQKLVQRNKVAFGAAAAVVATLVASTVFSTAQAVRARREAARASRSELLANQETAISQAVSDFLTEDLLMQVASKKQGDSGYTPNPNLSVREALDRAARSVGDRFKDKPITEAAVRTVIARAYSELGENRLALSHAERAFALQKDILGAEHPTTLATMHKLAGALWGYRRDAEGEALMVQTLEIRKRVLGLEHRDTLISMKGVARVYNTQGKYAESVALLLPALDISQRVLGPEDPETLSAMNNLFHPYRGLGMYDEGEALAVKTWELRKRVLGILHPDTLATMFNVAEAYALLGRPAEAAALFAQNLELRQRVFGPEHLSTMETTDYLGRVLIRLRKFEQAESMLRPLLASRLKVIDDWRAQVTRGSLGAALAGESKWIEAETLLIASQQGLEGNLHRVPMDQRVRVQEVLESLVQLYATWDKPASVAEWQKRLNEFKTTTVQGKKGK